MNKKKKKKKKKRRTYFSFSIQFDRMHITGKVLSLKMLKTTKNKNLLTKHKEISLSYNVEKQQ